ncbi:MAG: HDIG domain-containing metalloprotein [Verrucomicrobiales bacterium]
MLPSSWAVHVDRLDHSRVLRILLFAFAGVLVLSFVAQPPTLESRGDAFTATGLRPTIFALFFLGTSIFHLYLGHRERIYQRNRRIFVVYGLILLQLLLARFGNWLSEASQIGSPLMLVPMALAPVVLCVLLGQRMGIFAAIHGSLLTATVVNPEESFLFVIIGLGCGLVGIAATRKVRKRSRLIRAGVFVGITHLVLCWAFGVSIPVLEDPTHADWKAFFTQSLGVLAIEMGAVILVSGLLPVFEGVADMTTDISWIEMSDLNHPLLKRMTIEAPGTYHHSLVVATLGEAAAEAVGANATMVRVCSYFHDIGKLENPGFFIENQGGGPNPHDQLTPSMSALKIISHVRDGVALGRKEKLNRHILDGIREHHGDSLVAYFHRKAIDLHTKQLEEVGKGLRKEEDVCQINEDEFRYPGPRPSSRESAILSLADAVESASRTLREHTPEAIESLIERIFDARLRDGQLTEAPLSLKELTRVRQSFASTLGSLLHSRVPYPTEREDGSSGPRPLPGGKVEAPVPTSTGSPTESSHALGA